jgi:anti-sigma B factor antagonist
MGLAVSSERNGSATVVRLQGDFDLHSAARVRSEVEDLVEEPGHEVFVDLTQVDFLDSSGLGTLVGLQKRANRSQASLALCGLPKQLEKIIDVTHLRDAFTILPEVPDRSGREAG